MTTASWFLLLAVVAQGLLTLGLLWLLGSIRVPLVTRGEVAAKDVALSREPWPARAKQVANAYDNQFQLPVLFYVSALLFLQLGPGWLEAVLAWVFVATRLVHAAIFVTSNHVIPRFVAFTAGFVAIAALWLALAVRVLFGLVAG